MLTDLTTELAESIVPDIFSDVGTRLCEIVRTVETPSGYGGVDATDQVVATDIPCVFRSVPGNVRYQLGTESFSGRVLMPFVFGGSPLGLLPTDRIRLLADDRHADQIFQVRNPVDKDNLGVYYEADVVEEK